MQRQPFPVPGAPPGTITLSPAVLALVRSRIAKRQPSLTIDPVAGIDWIDWRGRSPRLAIAIWDRSSLQPHLIDTDDGTDFVFTALDWRRYAGQMLDLIDGKLVFVHGKS